MGGVMRMKKVKVNTKKISERIEQGKRVQRL